MAQRLILAFLLALPFGLALAICIIDDPALTPRTTRHHRGRPRHQGVAGTNQRPRRGRQDHHSRTHHQALPVGPILCLAFNKRIAEEMKKRLPGHVTCKTLNAVGHGVWATAVGKSLTVDTRKSFEILKGVINDLPKAHQGRSSRCIRRRT
jgi:hypothetical protein